MDISAVFLMFLLAYLLRFNLDIHAIPFPLAWYHALLTVFVFGILSFVFRSYSGLIRHTTLTDILLIFVVTTCSYLILLIISYLSRFLNWNRIFIIPVSVIIIHYVSITVFLFFSKSNY
jgi:FlaA1/EpsC-like NDP-sugar epimerase